METKVGKCRINDLKRDAASAETALHRIRCRTIKNSKTVTITAMAANAYIIQSVENSSAEMVVIAFAISV